MNERQKSEPALDLYDSERDSLSARYELDAIVDVLKTRFPNYSDEARSLAFLSPALDFETLRQILKLASSATSFQKFCAKLDALQASRASQVKALDEEQSRELVTAQIFNNFIVAILEKRRKIGASFLRRYVGEISSKVAQELDFNAYETAPTVHIFGTQVARLCDLVFTIPFKDRSKGAQAVAVPLEHKSTQTRNVVVQLLTSLILVLQYILRHKERFQRSDKKFVWPFLLLFYTGARPWRKVLNLPDLFATPDERLDRRWIFKLPFKFISLFTRSKKRVEEDPWLEAFLELTKGAERIVAKKVVTEEDWKKAANDAFEKLKGKFDFNDEEDKEIFSEFVIFIGKFSIRQGWQPPTREEITHKIEELGGANMNVEINSIYDIGKYYGWKDGKREGKQEGIREGKREGIREGKREGIREGKREGKREGDQERLRTMLKQCLTLRFPQMAQTTINGVMSIADPGVLESIFKVACTADSLDRFQRDVRGIAPIN